jgi:signal transduction histidine kinase
MGLGLALARKIIQAHGGTLSLISEPGHGACFLIELPIADALRARSVEDEARAEAVSI